MTENGDCVQGRIQALMKDIEADINKTGNLINKVRILPCISSGFPNTRISTTNILLLLNSSDQASMLSNSKLPPMGL